MTTADQIIAQLDLDLREIVARRPAYLDRDLAERLASDELVEFMATEKQLGVVVTWTELGEAVARRLSTERPDAELSELQEVVLHRLASLQLATARPVTGKRLRAAGAADEIQAALESVPESILTRQGFDPTDEYSLTLQGILRFSDGVAGEILLKLIRYLGTLYRRDPNFSGYEWRDLQADGGFSDEQFTAVLTVLQAAHLSGSSAAFDQKMHRLEASQPHDIEELVGCKTIDDFLALRERQQLTAAVHLEAHRAWSNHSLQVLAGLFAAVSQRPTRRAWLEARNKLVEYVRATHHTWVIAAQTVAAATESADKGKIVRACSSAIYLLRHIERASAPTATLLDGPQERGFRVPEAPASLHPDATGKGRAVQPVTPPTAEYDYEVALSFAGEDRAHAEALAAQLQASGVSVFYDRYETATLWGKDLVAHFHEVYSQRARYIVLFVSASYKEKIWTNHERRAAQERALRERGAEYILPIRIDGTPVPGLPETIGYLGIELGVHKIHELLLEKLGQPAPHDQEDEHPQKAQPEATRTTTPPVRGDVPEPSGGVESDEQAGDQDGGSGTKSDVSVAEPPHPRAHLNEREAADDAHRTSKVSTPFFVVGSVVLALAVGLAVWGFGVGQLTPDQREILRWAFSLASGFAVGAFVGGFVIRSFGAVLSGLAGTVTGGCAVWLVTFSSVFLPQSDRYDLLVEFRQADGRPAQVSGRFVILLGAEEHGCEPAGRASCRIPNLPTTVVGKALSARLDSSEHDVVVGRYTFEEDGNISILVEAARKGSSPTGAPLERKPTKATDPITLKTPAPAPPPEKSLLKERAFTKTGVPKTTSIVLNAEWSNLIIQENRSVASGKELRGRLNPSTWVDLSLQNSGDVPMENLAIKIEGNANARGEPSEFFGGKKEDQDSYLLESVWRSKPGVTLQAALRGIPKNEALSLTTLPLGRFTWGERTEGIYYLKLVVTASGIAKPATFVVSLDPAVVREISE